MRAARVVVALALVIGVVCAGLWLYRAERSANIVVPAAPPLASAATKATPPADTSTGKAQVVAAAAPVRPAPASASSASFSTFRGRVIDAATRQPIHEFVVEFLGTQATKVGNEAPGSRTFKSGDGRFEWDYLPPGSWYVIVSASGYQRFDLMYLTLSPGMSTPEIAIPMRAGHVVVGRVYDESTGAGIPEAIVQFREAGVGRWEGNFRNRPNQRTGTDGAFRLDGVPPGAITLSIHAQNYAGTELDVTVTESTPGIEIALTTGGTIAGRLMAADGVTPVTGSVSVFSDDTRSGTGRSTGKEGQFSFAHLAPGRYRVTGQSAAGSVMKEVALARGQRIENLVLEVDAGRAIRGTVTGLRPDWLAHVSVSLQRGDAMGGHEARVDERGHYTMIGVMPGAVDVVADVASRVQLRKRVVMSADSDQTVDFAFPRGARVSGRVTRQGRPVSSIPVYPRPLVENQDFFHYGSHSSPEGEYVIEQLPPGDYHIYAGAFRSRLLRVSGDTVFDIEIPGAQLSGRVVEAGKVPVVGALVELWDSNPGGQHVHVHEQTDHFGAFDLVGIEPGDYTLTAYKAGYSMYRERFTYTAPLADLVLPIQRDRGVEIRVRHADTGKAADSVYIVEDTGRQHGTRLHLTLDEFGVGYLPGALSGKTLSFASGNYEPIVIRDWSGQSLDLRLVLPKSQ